MKMKNNLIIALILGTAFVSCDPAQTIELENKLDTDSTVKFYFTGGEHYKFDGFLTKDSLILKLAPSEKRVFDFGIGTWEIHNSLDSLTTHINKIVIETEKSTETFVDDHQVKLFFQDRLTDDRYKAKIIIEIN